MEITDEDKLQLKKMVASEWWKVLEKLIQSKIDYFNEQVNISAHDYTKVREKVYDELNLNGAMIRGMSLVLKAPYDILNKEAKDNIISQLNEYYRQEVKKLER
jgi:hypothetical protein